MYKELKVKLFNVLKAEFDYAKTHENDENSRINKMNDIYHMQQILMNFEELEPVIREHMYKKAEKERFER